jgi:hypothetical protein
MLMIMMRRRKRRMRKESKRRSSGYLGTFISIYSVHGVQFCMTVNYELKRMNKEAVQA